MTTVIIVKLKRVTPCVIINLASHTPAKLNTFPLLREHYYLISRNVWIISSVYCTKSIDLSLKVDHLAIRLSFCRKVMTIQAYRSPKCSQILCIKYQEIEPLMRDCISTVTNMKQNMIQMKCYGIFIVQYSINLVVLPNIISVKMKSFNSMLFRAATLF